MSNQDTIKKLGAVINENLPHILTGVAAVGVVTTAVEAVKAVLKVKKIDANEDDERKPSDKAKSIVWSFVPAVVSGVLTIVCIVSSDVVHTKRYTSLLGAFVLTKSEFEKHKDDLKELLGPDKTKEIEQQLAEKRVARASSETDESTLKKMRFGDAVEDSKYVKHKVVDQVTGATFKSSYAALLRGEAAVAKEVARTGHATLEWFYSAVTDEADYPEIATRIYWDQTERKDLMDLRINADVSPEGELFYTIDYEYNAR